MVVSDHMWGRPCPVLVQVAHRPISCANWGQRRDLHLLGLPFVGGGQLGSRWHVPHVAACAFPLHLVNKWPPLSFQLDSAHAPASGRGSFFFCFFQRQLLIRSKFATLGPNGLQGLFQHLYSRTCQVQDRNTIFFFFFGKDGRSRQLFSWRVKEKC